MVIPVVFGVFLITFILSRIMPGNPFLEPTIMIKGDPDFVRRQLEFYGLDEPIYIQFFIYLENMFKGDWGVSLAIAENIPVWYIIRAKIPITLEVGLYSILLSSLIGVRFASIFGGAILLETTFNLKGFGMLFVEAILGRDYFVINALVFIISMVFATIVVVVDILYAVIDPRIRY